MRKVIKSAAVVSTASFCYAVSSDSQYTNILRNDGRKQLIVGDYDVPEGYPEICTVPTKTPISKEIRMSARNDASFSPHWVDNRVCPICGLKAEISTDTVDIDDFMVIGKTETHIWHCPSCDWVGHDVALPSYGYVRMTRSDFAGLGMDSDEIQDEIDNQETYAEWLAAGKEARKGTKKVPKDLADRCERWLESQGLGLITETEIIGYNDSLDDDGDESDAGEFPGMSIIEVITPREKEIRKFESIMDMNPKFISKDKLVKFMDSIPEGEDNDIYNRACDVMDTRDYYWTLWFALGKTFPTKAAVTTTKVLHPVYAAMVSKEDQNKDINFNTKKYALKDAYSIARKNRINKAKDHDQWIMCDGGIEGDFFCSTGTEIKSTKAKTPKPTTKYICVKDTEGGAYYRVVRTIWKAPVCKPSTWLPMIGGNWSIKLVGLKAKTWRILAVKELDTIHIMAINSYGGTMVTSGTPKDMRALVDSMNGTVKMGTVEDIKAFNAWMLK